MTIDRYSKALIVFCTALATLTAGALAHALTPVQQLALDIHKELVEFNTVTSTGDTLKAAEAVAARLKAAGFPDADVQVLSPAPNRFSMARTTSIAS